MEDKMLMWMWIGIAFLVALTLCVVVALGANYARAHHKYMRDEYVACMNAAKDYPSFAKCNDNSYQ